MKVCRVEAIPLDARMVVPFRFANVVRTVSSNVLLRVTTDDGIVGWGEACPVPQLSIETQESIVAIVNNRVSDTLQGADPLQWRPLLRRLRSQIHNGPFVLAAVETAVLDVVGKALGLAVCEVLGGRYRETVEVHGSVGWDEDARAMADSARAQAARYRVLKLYAGRGELETDLRRIESVREAVGDECPFLVDVNGMWRPTEALMAGARLASAGVRAVEQPISAQDVHGLAEVTMAYGTEHAIDVVADESIMSPADVSMVVRHRAARVANVGMSKLGGPVAAFDTALAAMAGNLSVMVGSVVELGIAAQAGLHLAASLPKLAYPSYLTGPHRYAKQITWPHLQPREGHLTVPTQPGLGIEVDEDAVAAMDLRRTAGWSPASAR